MIFIPVSMSHKDSFVTLAEALYWVILLVDFDFDLCQLDLLFMTFLHHQICLVQVCYQTLANNKQELQSVQLRD